MDDAVRRELEPQPAITVVRRARMFARRRVGVWNRWDALAITPSSRFSALSQIIFAAT
jgi:hypothetical protein